MSENRSYCFPNISITSVPVPWPPAWKVLKTPHFSNIPKSSNSCYLSYCGSRNVDLAPFLDSLTKDILLDRSSEEAADWNTFFQDLRCLPQPNLSHLKHELEFTLTTWKASLENVLGVWGGQAVVKYLQYVKYAFYLYTFPFHNV